MQKQPQNGFNALREMQKQSQNGFTTPWKWRKHWKLHFQPLGNGENAENCISNPLEMEKTLKIAFPTPWKQKKHLEAALHPPWKQKDGCLNRIHVKYVSFEVFRQSVDYHNSYLIWCFLQHLVTLKILAICVISACNLRQDAWWFQSLCEVKWQR